MAIVRNCAVDMWQSLAQLAALALLGSYLIVKQRQRERARAREPLDERHMTGTAFNARAVTPRIRQVRQDYVAQIHSRPKPTSRREMILATFRNAVRQLSYFRNAEAHSDWPGRERATHKA